MSRRSLQNRTPRVILLGTDPHNPRGGIGVAIPAYRAALESAGIFHEFIPSYNATARGGKWWIAIKAVPRMIRSIRALRRSKLDPVVYTHAGAWPSLVRERMLLLLAGLAGARTMLQIHSQTAHEYLEHRVGRLMMRRGLAGVDTVCVLTRWWQDRLSSAGIRNTLAVVPNPLPPALEQIARSARTPEPKPSGDDSGQLRILSITRLVYGKRIDVVINSMAQLPSFCRCTIAGEGPERASLEDLVRKRGLEDRIEFVGWVTGDAKKQLLSATDVFCLPSTYDSFGMGYVEAMAHGVPVVALRFGAIPDVVAEGQTGLLVGAPDPEQVADAILKLSDPDVRRRMGERAKCWVLERFGTVAVGDTLKRLVEEDGVEERE